MSTHAFSILSWFIWFLFISLGLIHSNKHLPFPFMPPTSAFNYLSDSRIVVTRSDEKFEIIASCFWFSILIFLIQNLIQFLHKLNVNCLLKIRFLQFQPIQLEAMPFRNRYVEVLKKFYHVSIFRLCFLFKQNQNYLVYFLEGLVDITFLQVFVCLQHWLFQSRWGEIFIILLGVAFVHMY
jgi:hypothetical protein